MKTWSAADAKRRFSRKSKAFAQKTMTRWIEELQPLHELEGDMEPPTRRDRPDPVGAVE